MSLPVHIFDHPSTFVFLLRAKSRTSDGGCYTELIMCDACADRFISNLSGLASDPDFEFEFVTNWYGQLAEIDLVSGLPLLLERQPTCAHREG
jgi:hypothetical protein